MAHDPEIISADITQFPNPGFEHFGAVNTVMKECCSNVGSGISGVRRPLISSVAFTNLRSGPAPAKGDESNRTEVGLEPGCRAEGVDDGDGKRSKRYNHNSTINCLGARSPGFFSEKRREERAGNGFG